MRGEHPTQVRAVPALRGSSPHARGTLSNYEFTRRPLRIIPACAGNTRPMKTGLSQETDHPRMRGEHFVEVNGHNIASGSSPHARGTRSFYCTKATVPRIIPACAGTLRYSGSLGFFPRIIPTCAGNTVLLVFKGFYRSDHPHMRGEHFVRL